MEKSAVSGSSKVTVEYTDPSGVFPLIAHDLYQRLPLRNLHWNSASRPLRSISSLHIELVADSNVSLQDTSTPPISGASNQANENGLASHAVDFPRAQAPVAEEPRKARRHQIPGLRQTPYLKVYLLRCGDTESYKATSRKLLREWIKNHTPQSQSSTSISKQENHDAFEWLIVHVVLSGDDVSASRLSGSSKSDSRWPTRTSSSVIEKIRADFNGTSKSAVDRVAQVKATEISDGVEASSRPTPSVNQTSGYDHRGWEDLINKLKFLILASFDLRVSQYEEDIREKASQRNLPGWNFNTFFVLKEGLARGFESVGLVEDALTGYHELAVGLKAAIDERKPDESPDQPTHLFRGYTEDVLEELKQAISSEISSPKTNHNSTHTSTNSPQVSNRAHDFGASILDTDRKPFRELILANNISAFDFQCYVFARQVSLLLRLANAVSPEHWPATDPATNAISKEGKLSSTAESRPSDSEPQVLLILADVCRRALEFITSAACALRDDLKTSVDLDFQEGHNNALSKVQVDNIVENLLTSWKFSASQCVLKRTSVRSLSDRLQPLLRQMKPNHQGGENSSEKAVGFPNVVHRENLPNRTSSLPPRPPSTNRPSSPEKLPSLTSLDAMRLLPPTSSQTGFQELAAQRADLSSLARRSLCSLGLRIGGWRSGWADLASVSLMNDEAMEEVTLDEGLKGDETNTTNHAKDDNTSTVTGTRNEALLSATASKSAFYKAYEDLTASALGYYVLGERQKSGEGMTADIAAVRFYLEDYDVAASYFHQLAPFYANNNWNYLEMSVLEMYAQCLRRLDRNQEYIAVALHILEKIVQRRRIAPRHQMSGNASGHLRELISASKSLDQPISIPMGNYFGDIRLDPFLHHSDVHDGFRLLLQFLYLMPGSLVAQNVRARIVTVDEEQRNEIWLAAEGNERLEPGSVKVLLGSNFILPAWYRLDQIMIQSENIIFTHHLSPPASGPFFAENHDVMSRESNHSTDQARILVWAHPRALEARLYLSYYRSINLGHTHSLVVEVCSGWNAISEGRIQVRPATAGLRLHTADAELQDNNTSITDKSQTGSIRFGNASAGTTFKVTIPYSLEHDLTEISVKLEVHYTTIQGNFIYACNPKIWIQLPVDVSVQDTFKGNALFSKFAISTVGLTPLRVSKCSLEGTRDFEVSTPLLADSELDVLDRQPLSLVSKIYRSAQSKTAIEKPGQLQRRLVLQIDYSRVDEEIMLAVERSFSSTLADSPFQQYARVLVPALSSLIRSRNSLQVLETVSLMREVDIGTFQDYNWEAALSGLPPGYRYDLANWLKEWFKTHSNIPVPSDLRESITHYLTVSAEIPQLQVVHTAHLRLASARTENQTEPSLVAIGHTLPAELTIKHTRQWGTLTDYQDGNEPLEFCYEIQASPDVWLIGGQRKAHFYAREDESLSFPVILLPQRTGHLLLPSVDVRPSRPHGSNEVSDSERSSTVAISSWETDYRNQGETVLVVPNLSSTTVSLDPHGSTNGAWLVESKSRGG